MVNAGLLPMAVVDDHKANFWAKVFDRIEVRSDLAVNTGGQIGWAIRKNSPLLLTEVAADFSYRIKKSTGIATCSPGEKLKSAGQWADNQKGPILMAGCGLRQGRSLTITPTT